MTIADFLSRNPGQDLASPNKIIPTSFQSRELLNITDILCPTNRTPALVKRMTRMTSQPGEVAPIWPLQGETKKT